MPKVSQIEIFKVDIPFKFSFSHARKIRLASESIFVKIGMENGICGFGESLPRHYVTGQTQESTFQELKNISARFIGLDLKDLCAGVDFVKSLEGVESEVRCALEVAFLDCLGRLFTRPVYELLGERINTQFIYSGVISGNSLLKLALLSNWAKREKFRFIKVKVGLKNDLRRLGLCRKILKDADLRIDANGVWCKDEALAKIAELRQFNISCIEQPTPKDDLDAMKQIADLCAEPIMADESLCTPQDALKLAKQKACDVFNVRLSKCGGIFRSLEIIKIARDSGLDYQIGCHVGETGVLSAAARHLASVVYGTKYLEGCYSRFILKEDLVYQDLTPKEGIAYILDTPGLGVEVNEKALRKYTKESSLIK